MFVLQLVQANNNGNIKASGPHCWPLWGKCTSHSGFLSQRASNKVTPVWGDFMFSVCFRRVRVRRRTNFSLSRQPCLSWTFDIWHKEYMGLEKCTGWPFHDLDPRSRLWRWLAKICLSAQKSKKHSSDHYKMCLLFLSFGVITPNVSEFSAVNLALVGFP